VKGGGINLEARLRETADRIEKTAHVLEMALGLMALGRDHPDYLSLSTELAAVDPRVLDNLLTQTGKLAGVLLEGARQLETEPGLGRFMLEEALKGDRYQREEEESDGQS
jgi:hypothetical protein